MKIKFVLYKLSKDSLAGKKPISMVFVSSWAEAEKYIKRGYHNGGLSRQMIETIKLLEYNKYFIKEVSAFRESRSVPKKIDYVKFKKDKLYYLPEPTDEDEKKDLRYRAIHEFLEIDEIANEYNTPNFIRPFLVNLFYTDVVDLFYKQDFDKPLAEGHPITVTTLKNAYGNKVVSLNIYDGNVKIGMLTNFIEKNSKEILSEITELPKYSYAKKSKQEDTRKRDLRIYELMEKGMTAEKVSDKISAEFENKKCQNDLEIPAVRTAYKTIKGEIYFLFNPKDKKIKRIRRKAPIKKRKIT